MREGVPLMQQGGGHGIQAQRVADPVGPLTAPFPYYGGKSRWADRINERLGTVGVYVEPCAGSFACGLRRKPSPREIMCDTDHLLINAMRGLAWGPDETAYWASWPTFHADLTARQPWLIRWRAEHGWRVTEDPDWFDPKAAGWWIWGASNWIGGGWCSEQHRSTERGIPAVACAKGVQAQRVSDKRPAMQNGNGSGIGVQAQRCDDKRPHVAYGGGFGVQPQRGKPSDREIFAHNGRGVNSIRNTTPEGGEGDILDGTRWQPWFRVLAKRLERVVILNRGWESAVTDSMLQHTPSGPQPVVGIMFDPPYLTRYKGMKLRDGSIYHGDEHADQVAAETYEWAVAHGEKFRIAYCCGAGDFPVPKGWTYEGKAYAGVRKAARRKKRRDCVMYSPACVGQQELFD